MTALSAQVPATGLEWRQWVRGRIEDLGLCCGEANMLRLLGDRASSAGVVRMGVPLMARQLALSEARVYWWLARLRERGLLVSSQQGPGRVAVRRLVAVAEPEQLSLFDEPAARAAMPVPDPAVVAPWPLADATLPSRQREAAVVGQLKEEGARDARDPDRTSLALEEHLEAVLEVLDAAPELFVEAMAVNSALAAHPERAGHDHLRAAHIVASWAHEGGLHVTAANRLLLTVLRKQSLPATARAAGRGGGRWHGGRRRASAPVTAEVAEEFERQTASVERLMAAAGFGCSTP